MALRSRVDNLPPLTSKASDAAFRDLQEQAERSSKVPMGRHSRRALDKFLSHADRCGAAHIKDFVRLGACFAEERAKELCLAL